MVCGGVSYYVGHRAGDGGVAGRGGNIKVSRNAKIYAFNGNRYTDGTSYGSGLNQCPIYLQAGKSPKRQMVDYILDHSYPINEVWVMQTTSEERTNLALTGYSNSMYTENSAFLF